MSVHGPLFDMPTCMSKFLALGMSLDRVVRACTSRPAEVLGLQGEVGTLKPGAYADVALFRLSEGDYTFYDVFMNARKGRQLLRNTLTVLNGRPMERVPDGPTMPWIELTEDQRALVERKHTPAALAESGCC
jgi:dihydroorotase